MKQESQDSTFMESFISKLKEQSFTIIILVGVMYYQNYLFMSQMEEYKKVVQSKDELILKLTNDERARLLERETYLIQQRDKFIEDLRQKELTPNN